jgi:Glycosyl transferases group 1
MNGYWYGRNSPGILIDALQRVGPAVAELTVVGGVSPPIAAQLTRATGHPLVPVTTRSRRELYERLEQADAAVVTIDHTSAGESRIPAKVYDYLTTGVPVIAVCPPGAALLRIPEAHRFHHIHHRDLDGLVTLLRQARRDRSTLHTGRLGEGPTRELGIQTLHTTLSRLLPDKWQNSGSRVPNSRRPPTGT